MLVIISTQQAASQFDVPSDDDNEAEEDSKVTITSCEPFCFHCSALEH